MNDRVKLQHFPAVFKEDDIVNLTGVCYRKSTHQIHAEVKTWRDTLLLPATVTKYICSNGYRVCCHTNVPLHTSIFEIKKQEKLPELISLTIDSEKHSLSFPLGFLLGYNPHGRPKRSVKARIRLILPSITTDSCLFWS